MIKKASGLSTLTAQLRELDTAGRIGYLGVDRPGGNVAINVQGRVRDFTPRQMLDWLDGFNAATRDPNTPRRRDLDDREHLRAVRAILICPSLTDQARIQVRYAMQEQGLGTAQLAQRVGVTAKSVAEVIRLGGPGTIGLMAHLGRDSTVLPELASADPNVPLEAVPPAGWREPDSLGRLRLLGYAHEHRLIHWIGPVALNLAVAAHTFHVQIGAYIEQIRADAVRPWLVGAADVVQPDAAEVMYTAHVDILTS